MQVEQPLLTESEHYGSFNNALYAKHGALKQRVLSVAVELKQLPL